jgi:GT2 family glycosyltransferase
MTEPEISVCVAVYREHPPPNLRSLHASLTAAAGAWNTELIVVLNGIDGGMAGVPAAASHVAFAVNQGVPIAWNAAARTATGKFLCFVNDDVILGPGALDMLAATLASHAHAGVVGPVGTMWDLEIARHQRYVDLSAYAPGHAEPCDVLSGFLLMTPRDVFETVGGFDEALTPCGFEEVDYCTAVRRRAHLEALAVAGVPVEHRFGISAKRPWRRLFYAGRSERLGAVTARNRAHFIKKWSAV